MTVPVIISVIGPPGSGKSTLVARMLALSSGIASLHFDHYQRVRQQAPRDLCAWINEGADYSAFVIPQLEQDLAKLKTGHSITDPQGTLVESKPVILFENLLGIPHQASNQFVDFNIWVDTPRDIALARNLKAFTDKSAKDSAQQLQWMADYLDNYLVFIRRGMDIQRQRNRTQADWCVDGNSLTDEALLQLWRNIQARCGVTAGQ